MTTAIYRCDNDLDLIIFPGTLDTLAVFRIKTSVIKVTKQSPRFQLFTSLFTVFLAEAVNNTTLISVFTIDELYHRVNNVLVFFADFI
jgi:hypothetical protein